MGRRVLAIDLDPQSAMTRRFDRAPGDAPATAFELLAGDGELNDAVLIDVEPGVDLLAAKRELAKLELSLAGEHHREQFLADLLHEAVDGYDDVVIDCPPSLGLLTVNALVASSQVLVPVDMTDEGALQGAAEVRAIVARLARRALIEVRALVRTMVDRRRIVYQRMAEGLEDLKLPVAETEIPLTAAFQSAAADRRPLLAARPDNAGAKGMLRCAISVTISRQTSRSPRMSSSTAFCTSFSHGIRPSSWVAAADSWSWRGARLTRALGSVRGVQLSSGQLCGLRSSLLTDDDPRDYRFRTSEGPVALLRESFFVRGVGEMEFHLHRLRHRV